MYAYTSKLILEMTFLNCKIPSPIIDYSVEYYEVTISSYPVEDQKYYVPYMLQCLQEDNTPDADAGAYEKLYLL